MPQSEIQRKLLISSALQICDDFAAFESVRNTDTKPPPSNPSKLWNYLDFNGLHLSRESVMKANTSTDGAEQSIMNG